MTHKLVAMNWETYYSNLDNTQDSYSDKIFSIHIFNSDSDIHSHSWLLS